MESEFGDEDLEAQMEAFMQRQAEIEAGESKGSSRWSERQRA